MSFSQKRGGGAGRTGRLLTESEICSLFNGARERLASVNGLQQTKSQVVLGLASALEEGTDIPLQNISAEIVRQLNGLVSGRFVRQCLPEKYKQTYRVKNAKAQAKTKTRLAAIAPLNKQVTLIFKKNQLTDVLNFSKDSEFTYACVQLRSEGDILEVEVITPSEGMSDDEHLRFMSRFALWKLSKHPITVKRRVGI